MDILPDSENVREDGYTTQDDVNLNTFFNDGPDLDIEEFEQEEIIENGDFCQQIEIDNHEVNQVICVIDTQVPQV